MTQCHVECGCPAGGSCCFSCPLPECIYVTGEHPLTLRRRENQNAVVILRSAGMNRTQVASRLGMSTKSVSTHWARHLEEARQ